MNPTKRDSHQQVLSNMFGQRKRTRQPLVTQPANFKSPIEASNKAEIADSGGPSGIKGNPPGFLGQARPAGVEITQTTQQANRMRTKARDWPTTNPNPAQSVQGAGGKHTFHAPTPQVRTTTGYGDKPPGTVYHGNIDCSPAARDMRQSNCDTQQTEYEFPTSDNRGSKHHHKGPEAQNPQNASEGKWKSSRPQKSKKTCRQRFISGSIRNIQDWSSHKESIPFIAEVYGQLNSQVSTNAATGAQEFFIKDSSGTMKCCFWPMDRDLPRMSRLQSYRCAGTYHTPLSMFRCASVRPLRTSEEGLIQSNIHASECAFNEATLLLHEV